MSAPLAAVLLAIGLRVLWRKIRPLDERPLHLKLAARVNAKYLPRGFAPRRTLGGHPSVRFELHPDVPFLYTPTPGQRIRT